MSLIRFSTAQNHLESFIHTAIPKPDLLRNNILAPTDFCRFHRLFLFFHALYCLKCFTVSNRTALQKLRQNIHAFHANRLFYIMARFSYSVNHTPYNLKEKRKAFTALLSSLQTTIILLPALRGHCRNRKPYRLCAA